MKKPRKTYRIVKTNNNEVAQAKGVKEAKRLLGVLNLKCYRVQQTEREVVLSV